MKKFLLVLLVSIFTISTIAQTVFITRTGKKYHIESCRYLRSSSISITLSEAINRGYSACSICAPPQTPSNPPSKPSQPNIPKESPQSPSKNNRCTAITKAGNQCSRNARSNGLCWQHGG